jgi:hypothetical protein
MQEIRLERTNTSSLVAEKLGHRAPAHVFTGRLGAPWSQWAVQSQMRRLNVDWHFHLCAKAATDAQHAILESTQRSAHICAESAQNQ